MLWGPSEIFSKCASVSEVDDVYEICLKTKYCGNVLLFDGILNFIFDCNGDVVERIEVAVHGDK